MFKLPAALTAMLMSAIATVPAAAQTLEAYAVLPANTFESGPTSGQFITPANGVTLPSSIVNRCRAFRRSSEWRKETSW
jgi:hypothetical protein